MALRRLRAYPKAILPLAVWGWGPSVRPDQIERGLERIVRLGFGGAVIAPRESGWEKVFLSPLWLESLEAAERAARKLDVEIWAEAPLRNLSASGLLPHSDLGRQIALCPVQSSFLSSQTILAWYRRDASGRMRRVLESDPSRLREESHMVLYSSRTDGPDFFELSVSARYAAKVLEPHQSLFACENRLSAFRGFFLGPVREVEGELFNEYLTDQLEEEGFDDFIGRAPDLFGETTGGEAAFAHYYRRFLAQGIQKCFAEPLVQWARERQVMLVGPAERSWDDAFPAWVFSAAGMLRMVQSRSKQMGTASERLVSDRIHRTPFVSLSCDSLDCGERSSLTFHQTAEAAIACTGGRAVLDWIPFQDESPLEWDDDPCSLAVFLPQLRGVREMNMRLACWTHIGTVASRSPRVLVISPQTSYWRLPRPALCADHSARICSTEHRRLQQLMSRVENCLSALSFDFAVWNECSGSPVGLHPPLAEDRKYDLVILPGLLNLNRETWRILTDYAAAGGNILAMERYPAFVEGSASEELTAWARATIDRCESIDHLVAWLEDHIERPVRAISLSRTLDPRTPEVMGMEEEGECVWIAARNSDARRGVRALIETSCGKDEFVDEVDLETGSLSAAPSSVRLENVLSFEVDLAPGQSRVFRLQKAPLAEVESYLIETPPRFAEIVVGADWQTKAVDHNLLPLSSLEYKFPEAPWQGPESVRALGNLLEAQSTERISDKEILLKATFEIENGPPINLAEMLDLALYFHPNRPLISIDFNGETADAQTAVICNRTGLSRIRLPHTARVGLNELTLRVAFEGDSSLQAATPLILGGRFGVLPSHSLIADDTHIFRSPGGLRIVACPGDSERLTDCVSRELSLVEGIGKFFADGGKGPCPCAWLDWTGWPLLREKKSLHEIGMPFYGGMIKIEGVLTLPSPCSAVGHWKTAFLELGPTRASWAALKVNGSTVGSLGLPPCRREITGFLKESGRNLISLRLWFSWSEALAPFGRNQSGPSAELVVSNRGVIDPPRVILLG